MFYRGIAAASALLSLLFTWLFGSWWQLPVWFAGCFLGLFLLAAAFLVISCLVIDETKPQDHDSRFYRLVADLIVDAMVGLCRVRVHTQGLEKLPREGRFLLVCNHLALPDPAVLLRVFPKSQLAFISKQENQQMFLVGKLMHKLQCQLINRENDREALKTILRCIQLIKEDQASVAVFPEGKCSLDGRVSHFRSGVFKIAQKTGVPIVVCTLRNTPAILKNIIRLKPTDIPIHLVDVIQPEQYEGRTTVEIADMVYERMIADLGEDFRAAEN